ncbi:unnamed protein product [Cunninghamella echinulata]
MKGSSDDIARLIIFLQHRIELEEGYQNSLAQILKKLEENDITNPLFQSAVNTHSNKMINGYLTLDNSFKPSRTHFIQTLKNQLQSLMKLKEQHDKSRRLQRKNMQAINNIYITTRMEELPKARDDYFSKWEEIDRIQGSTTPVTPSIATPITPKSSRFDIASPKMSKSVTTKLSLPEEFSDTASLSSTNAITGDDSISTTLMTNQSTNQNKTELPLTPTQKKFHQFMKQFHMNHNFVEPSKQNVRLAKLKVEMNEADVKYRKIVRKLDNLTRKQQMANENAIRVLQTQLYEKSQCTKQTLDQVLSGEFQYNQHKNEMVYTLQLSLESLSPELDKTIFDNLLCRDKYPMPSPIYYINHRGGECKDLIFGMDLVEYSQLKNRSPPLVVTKCIEAVEKLNGLQKEGIYRISGKRVNVEKIKHAFERDEEALVFGENNVPDEVYCVSSVLKVFLRELATPLFPFTLTDRIAYSQIPDKELRLMNLLTRIIKLPGPNYDTLKVLLEHLAKLELFVEKNKMTVSNLSLLFTPAIFHDHNQPQAWVKDCVLEDLLANVSTLFADRDLRSASAITGVIDYGFEEQQYEEDNSEIVSVMTLEDEEEGKDEYYLPTPQTSPYTTAYTNEPLITDDAQTIRNENDISNDSNNNELPSILNQQGNNSKKNSKYRVTSIDKKLTVDTNYSIIKSYSKSSEVQHHTFMQPLVTISPSIQSATVPSTDWLNHEPEEYSHSFTSIKLRRSATTLSKRKKEPIPRLLSKNTLPN